jgi:hypothetical protein
MTAPLAVRGTAIRHRFGDTVAVDGLGLDFGVLIAASVVMIGIASALLGRLAR